MSGLDAGGARARAKTPTRDRIEPGEIDRRPDDSLDLLARPVLTPTNDAARDRVRWFRDAARALAWIVSGWGRPAGTEARWEQRSGSGSISTTSRTQGTRGPGQKQPAEPPGHGRRAQGQSQTSGTGQ